MMEKRRAKPFLKDAQTSFVIGKTLEHEPYFSVLRHGRLFVQHCK